MQLCFQCQFCRKWKEEWSLNNEEGQVGDLDDGRAGDAADLFSFLYYSEFTCELRQVQKDYLHK